MAVEKVEKPAEHFEKPKDVVKDQDLTPREKVDALDTWEQDARQLLTASNEGMPGAEEGLELKNDNRLDEVVKAKQKIGETPNPKPAHWPICHGAPWGPLQRRGQ